MSNVYNIETDLEKIISAVKGEEVRQAIHDSIQECHDEAIATKERLDAIEADLNAASVLLGAGIGGGS